MVSYKNSEIDLSEVKPDFNAIISRSRNVAQGMSKGIQFLFKKNSIVHIKGYGRLSGDNNVEVEDSEGNMKKYSANS